MTFAMRQLMHLATIFPSTSVLLGVKLIDCELAHLANLYNIERQDIRDVYVWMNQILIEFNISIISLHNKIIDGTFNNLILTIAPLEIELVTLSMILIVESNTNH